MRMLNILIAAPAFAQGGGQGGGQGGNQSNPAANQVQPAQGTSPPAQPRMFQPLGDFPDNEITARPYVGPQGGQQGLKVTVAALQRVLTELQQLELQIKEAHWNVSGSEFYQLHIEFQNHFEGVIKLADRVAQRLLAIGSSADGRATTIARTSHIPEIPGGFIDDAQVIAWFTNAYKTVGDETRQAEYDTANTDPATQNLLQSVEDKIDEYQWQMRAFVQNTHTDPNTGWQINNNQPIQIPGQNNGGPQEPTGAPQGGQPGAPPQQ
jgi:starvation-inducible DNA-binding protein